MLRTKSVPLSIKAAGTHEGTEDGVVEAIVAAYNLDSVGDKILPGAFEGTLAEWRGKGDPIPFIWSHEWGDPDSHIGVVEDAKETDDGLWIRARLDLDEPKAAKVYRLLKGRRVTQFSFGYEVEEGAFVDSKSDDGEPGHPYYELRKLKLFECGPCLVGANQQTSLEAVKAAPGVSEERIREIAETALAKATNQSLTAEEVDAVRALLAKSTTDTTETESQDEKATPEQSAVDEEPAEAKSDEPADEGTAALDAAQLRLIREELSLMEETTV